ncbi:Myocardin-related transcription factor B [Plecturocebus cupreus]
MEYYAAIKKDEFMSFAGKWIKLETIILSKLTQEQKTKHCMFSLVMLQLRLQQRRTREQLVDQGIMPPLKSPAAFHEQIKSLERARTENFLKHKIRSRPDRSELKSTGLKRLFRNSSSRVEQLPVRDKLVFKEGSLLISSQTRSCCVARLEYSGAISAHCNFCFQVQGILLPQETCSGVGKEDYPHTQGDFSFDEDSSDALSPDQPASQESQGSAASPNQEIPGGRAPRVASTTLLAGTAVLRAPWRGASRCGVYGTGRPFSRARLVPSPQGEQQLEALRTEFHSKHSRTREGPVLRGTASAKGKLRNRKNFITGWREIQDGRLTAAQDRSSQ